MPVRLRCATGLWWLQCLGRIAFAFLVVASAAMGQDLVHVEEDWELVVANPDNNSCGPQIACTMSPLGDIESTYFTLEINHRSLPYWTPGGITLHQWYGESRMASMDREDRSVMNTSNERVTWTQIMDTQDGVLTFQVKNGTSTTWGAFGYSNYLKLQSYWQGNLSAYTPDVSVARSGVAYASNRVQSLKILRVRGTLSDGTTATDNTVRVVYQLPN